jgi:hypothetical protein
MCIDVHPVNIPQKAISLCKCTGTHPKQSWTATMCTCPERGTQQNTFHEPITSVRQRCEVRLPTTASSFTLGHWRTAKDNQSMAHTPGIPQCMHARHSLEFQIPSDNLQPSFPHPRRAGDIAGFCMMHCEVHHLTICCIPSPLDQGSLVVA